MGIGRSSSLKASHLSKSRYAVALAAALLTFTTAATCWADKPDKPQATDGPLDAAREASRAAFRRGVAEARASNWPAARAAFEEAYRSFAHPSILLNMGIARLRTGDPVLAETDLVRFLADDAGASASELTSASEALAEARTKISTLRIVVSPALARISVDGKPVASKPVSDDDPEHVIADVRTLPGSHRVYAEADGFRAQEKRAVVTAQTESRVDLTLPRDGDTSPVSEGEVRRGVVSPRAIAGYSLLGLSGSAFIVAGASALRSLSLSNDYDDPRSSHFGDPSTRSEGVAFRTTADVALGVGIVSGVVAAVLLLTEASKTPTQARATQGILTW